MVSDPIFSYFLYFLCYENPVEKAFGALYVGAHAVDLLLGNLGQLVGLRCAGFIIEEHVQKYSYSSMGQSCSK